MPILAQPANSVCSISFCLKSKRMNNIKKNRTFPTFCNTTAARLNRKWTAHETWNVKRETWNVNTALNPAPCIVTDLRQQIPSFQSISTYTNFKSFVVKTITIQHVSIWLTDTLSCRLILRSQRPHKKVLYPQDNTCIFFIQKLWLEKLTSKFQHTRVSF